MGAAPRVFAWPDGHPDVLRVRPERDLLRQRLHQQARLLGARSRHRDALRRGLPGDDRAVAVLSGDLKHGRAVHTSRFSLLCSGSGSVRTSKFGVRSSRFAFGWPTLRRTPNPEPRTPNPEPRTPNSELSTEPEHEPRSEKIEA